MPSIPKIRIVTNAYLAMKQRHEAEENEMITSVLNSVGGSMIEASRRLGLHRRSLYRWKKKTGYTFNAEANVGGTTIETATETQLAG